MTSLTNYTKLLFLGHFVRKKFTIASGLIPAYMKFYFPSILTGYVYLDAENMTDVFSQLMLATTISRSCIRLVDPP